MLHDRSAEENVNFHNSALNMSDKLSSRVQGLKFMQRGAQRAALARGQSTPDATKISEPPAPAPVGSTSEQWVVPPERRVRVAAPPVDEPGNWDAWLASADNDEAPRATACRQELGKWNKRAGAHKLKPKPEPDSDPDSMSDFDSDSDSDSSDFKSAPGSPVEQGFRKPPSAAPRKRPATTARGSLRKKPLRGRTR